MPGGSPACPPIRRDVKRFGGVFRGVEVAANLPVGRRRRRPRLLSKAHGPNVIRCFRGADARTLRVHQHPPPHQYRQRGGLALEAHPTPEWWFHRYRSQRPSATGRPVPISRRAACPEPRECTSCACPTYGHASWRDQQSHQSDAPPSWVNPKLRSYYGCVVMPLIARMVLAWFKQARRLTAVRKRSPDGGWSRWCGRRGSG